MRQDKVFKIKFSSLYPLYVKKAEAKGRSKEEVDQIICWLTGYSPEGLRHQIGCEATLRPSSPKRQRSIQMPRLSKAWCAVFGWRKSRTRSCRRSAT